MHGNIRQPPLLRQLRHQGKRMPCAQITGKQFGKSETGKKMSGVPRGPSDLISWANHGKLHGKSVLGVVVGS